MINITHFNLFSLVIAGKYSPNGCFAAIQRTDHIGRSTASRVYRYRIEIYYLNVGNADQIKTAKAMRRW